MLVLSRPYLWAGVIALLLVGCGGSAPTSGAGGSSKAAANLTACQAVTQQDVSAVFGVQAGPGELGQGPASHITTCTYSGAARLLVRLSPEIGDREHAAYPFENPQKISGLGDDALFSATSSGTPTSTLSVLKGKAELSLFYGGPGDRLALLMALAKGALPRL